MKFQLVVHDLFPPTQVNHADEIEGKAVGTSEVVDGNGADRGGESGGASAISKRGSD